MKNETKKPLEQLPPHLLSSPTPTTDPNPNQSFASTCSRISWMTLALNTGSVASDLVGTSFLVSPPSGLVLPVRDVLGGRQRPSRSGGEDFDACRGDEHGLLELGRGFPVRGDGRPLRTKQEGQWERSGKLGSYAKKMGGARCRASERPAGSRGRSWARSKRSVQRWIVGC